MSWWFVVVATSAFAQPFTLSTDNHPGTGALDTPILWVNGQAQPDFNIPPGTRSIVVEVRGGDGNGTNGNGKGAAGGTGASIKATFAVKQGQNAITAGFIPGGTTTPGTTNNNWGGAAAYVAYCSIAPATDTIPAHTNGATFWVCAGGGGGAGTNGAKGGDAGAINQRGQPNNGGQDTTVTPPSTISTFGGTITTSAGSTVQQPYWVPGDANGAGGGGDADHVGFGGLGSSRTSGATNGFLGTGTASAGAGGDGASGSPGFSPGGNGGDYKHGSGNFFNPLPDYPDGGGGGGGAGYGSGGGGGGGQYGAAGGGGGSGISDLDPNNPVQYAEGTANVLNVPGPGPFLTPVTIPGHFEGGSGNIFHRRAGHWVPDTIIQVPTATFAAIAITFSRAVPPVDPNPPTAHITANPNPIYVNQTTTIDASFFADTGHEDSLTATEIRDKDGNAMASWNPTGTDLSKKRCTFSSPTPGDYPFSAWIQTVNFPTWKSYAEVTVSVIATDSDPVTLTISVEPATAASAGCTATPIATTPRARNETVFPSAHSIPGYSFNGWTGDIPADQDPRSPLLTFVMSRSRNLVAHFVPAPVTPPVNATLMIESSPAEMQNSRVHSPNHIINTP